MNKINIIIADDHPVLRMGLKAMFETDLKINVIAEAKNGLELLEKVKHLNPHIILLDYFFGDENGARITQLLKQNKPRVKVLAYSYSSEPIIIQKSLKAGAAGFVSKSEPLSLLVEGIYNVMAGKQYFSPSIQEIINTLQSTTEHKLQELTQREFEIMEYVAKEYSNKEIGAKLFISPRTVETHKRNIMQKLKLKNSVGLVNYYFRVLHSGISH